MRIYLGADHRGFELKEKLKAGLSDAGYEVVDVGAYAYDKEDDYVDFARKVVEGMDEGDRGVLICGSGHGMDMVSNRASKVRCIVGFNTTVTVQGREHEDANVVSLPSDWVSETEAVDIVKVFLETEFSGEERHVRRLKKINDLRFTKHE
jgi:ribose 5-phosphate isomerase B